MPGQFQVVCGKCKVAPNIIADADGANEAVCPSCSARDDANDAVRIAGEHFLQEAIPGIQKGTGDAFRGEFTEFTAEPILKRAFKWHAEVV